MKRDVDLIRQLMFELEHQGPECSFDDLRNGAHHDHESVERTRYHLRLLIDAGLAKEFDRATAGQPCVRLTSAGHEFLDLCRGDERWRQAKWLVHEQTGGLSLTVLRAVEECPVVVTVEEGTLEGGFGSAVLEAANSAGLDTRHIVRLGIPDRFIEHGERPELLADLGLDVAGICRAVREALEKRTEKFEDSALAE